MTKTNETTTFKPGTVYGTRSFCDHECVFRFKLVRRTAKSVWIQDFHNGEAHGPVVRRKIRVVDGVEHIDPKGRYSMSPILTADKDANGDRPKVAKPEAVAKPAAVRKPVKARNVETVDSVSWFVSATACLFTM